MPCPNCGGGRLALAALPGQRPEHLRVCLSCAHLWVAVEEPPAAASPTSGQPRAGPPDAFRPHRPPVTTVLVPGPALVVAIGDGAEAFVREHFAADAVPGPRAAAARLAGLRTAAVALADATRLRPLLSIADRHDLPAVAVVAHPVARQLPRDRFLAVHSVEALAEATVVRTPLPVDRRGLPGPFDVVGDVHGCLPELVDLLGELGHVVRRDALGRPCGATHPAGRTAVFVGDLVDRGPDTPGVLRLVMGMAATGDACTVLGNHDDALRSALLGTGSTRALGALAAEPPEFRADVRGFLTATPSHLVLDDGRLVVAHAGLEERYHGRLSERVRRLCLTGAPDAGGADPGRSTQHSGAATVVHGHTPIDAPVWRNGTICVDTGCVTGGRLTALRHPERELVSVPARAALQAASALPLTEAFGEARPPRP